jgi:cyclopropane-fatty-acyl-phospholipid synthase
LQRCLKPGGKAGLQIITIKPESYREYRSQSGFHPEICLSRRHAADPQHLPISAARWI